MKNKAIPMSVQDKKWRAESDARTLAEAEAIRTDRARMRAAATEAKRVANAKMAEAKAMKKIGGRARK